MQSTLTNPVRQDPTQEKIKQVFLQLLQTKRVEQIRIKEITDRIPTNRTAFYRYYTDIYDLYEQTLDGIIDLLQQNISIILQKAFTNKSLQVEDLPFAFLHENKTLLQLLLQDTRAINQIKRRQKAYIRQMLQLPEHDQPTDYALEFLLSGIIGLLSYWLQNNMHYPLQAMFSFFKEQIFNGLQSLQRISAEIEKS